MEQYGICLMADAALRKDPSERSEMVSQMLFGELAILLEYRKPWLRVRMQYDDYEGWMDEKQWFPLNPEQYEKFVKSWVNVVTDLLAYVKDDKKGIKFPVSMGASVPRQSREHFKVGSLSFSLEGKFITPSQEPERKGILRAARKYINAPYLWGGRSAFGLDCSGFVQIVYKANQIKLPRDASQQAMVGETIDFIHEVLPGDLAFFDDDEGRIIHTGILLNHHQIIHASGCVRIDPIDHNGIFDATKKNYSHRLRILKRPF